jgi:DNA-binding SARP family transcriptional activator/TolB-like protein
MTKSLSLRLLGRPSLSDEAGNPISGLPEKTFVLLAMVALGPPGGLTRPEAGQRLWEGSELSQSNANLRQLLFRVRRAEERSGISLFELDGNLIRLSPDIVDSDVRHLLATDAIFTAGAMHTLTKLYRGDLLASLSEPGDTLSTWLASERRKLREWFTRLVLDGIPRIDSLTAGMALRHLAELTPPTPEAAQALLRHLIDTGKTWEARRFLHEAGLKFGENAERLFAAESRLLYRPTAEAAIKDQPARRAAQPGGGAVPLVALMFSADPDLPRELSVFARALNEDITIALTRLKSLSVIAAFTADQIAGNAQGMADYFNLDYAVSTRLSPDPLEPGGTRLSVLLERMPTREMLWGDRYSFSIAAGPQHYAQVTNSLAWALVDKIERFGLRDFETTTDASSYASFLAGQEAIKVMDLRDVRRARRHFRDALDRSPDFAQALGGVAHSLILEWVLRGGNDRELLLRARASAERAAELNPLDGNGHRMVGRALLFLGDFQESLARFDRAKRLAPNHADLLVDFADTLMHNSDIHEANAQIEAALKLNPLAPDNYWWASAGIKFFMGEYQAALDHLSRLKNDEPVLRLIAASAAMAGQMALARSARIRAMAIDPAFRLDDWLAVLPQRNPVHRSLYREALKAAGFK